jgi:hypothetical protein
LDIEKFMNKLLLEKEAYYLQLTVIKIKYFL